MKKAIALFLSLIFVFSAALTASAASQAVPYNNYTYSEKDSSLVLGPQAYVPEDIIYGEDLGVGSFNTPSDVDADENGNIYILDTANSRVVVLNSDITLKNVISCTVSDGSLKLNNAQGITVSDKLVYICDTENGRILVFGAENGEYIKTFNAPTSSALGEKFIFKPTKLSVDNKGNLYVVSNGTYEGVINLNADGEFLSFFASNKVTSSAWDLFWRRFSTKQQRKTMLQLIPQDFSSIDIDKEGFFLITKYTTTDDSLVKRVNPGGTDVLRKTSNVPIKGDPIKYYNGTLAGESSFCDISSGSNKIYACLDKTRGRVFCYNNDGYMLYSFGNISNQFGGFKNPVALSYIGDERIAVIDAVDNSLTVFSPTDYAIAVNQGIKYQNALDYETAREQWQKVLKLNCNFEPALIMIGRSHYNNGEYETAMEYFEKASNHELYSNARKALRSEIIYDNAWVFVAVIIAVVVLALSVSVIKLVKKKRCSL